MFSNKPIKEEKMDENYTVAHWQAQEVETVK